MLSNLQAGYAFENGAIVPTTDLIRDEEEQAQAPEKTHKRLYETGDGEHSDFGIAIKAGGKALIVLFGFVSEHKSPRARLVCLALVNLLLTGEGNCASIARTYGMSRAGIRKYVQQLETITGKRGLLLGHRAEATRRRCRLARLARTKAAQ